MFDFSNGKFVVKFGATWCVHCKTVNQTLEKLAPDFSGIKFAHVDIDDHPQLAKKYSIKSVPTVIMIEDGREFKKPIVGSVTLAALKKTLKEFDAE
jgi:thioredoxin 1